MTAGRQRRRAILADAGAGSLRNSDFVPGRRVARAAIARRNFIVAEIEKLINALARQLFLRTAALESCKLTRLIISSTH